MAKAGNSKPKNHLLRGLIGTASGALTLSLSGAVVMFTSFTRGNHSTDVKERTQAHYDSVNGKYASQLWSFTSFDGLNLKAHYYSSLEPSHVYAITVHGYHGNHTDMMPYAEHYLEAGYNVLMPDLRGHGLSEGSYVGFGYHDHYDLCGWIDLLIEKDPEARIILHGISMGAATVMMASGEYLSPNVKCAVEDAGFTDAFEQCTYNMKDKYHLPAFPILHILDLMMRLFYKYSLHDATPIKSVSHANVPILFIHGSADDFVPFSMQQPLYEACSSEKELLVVEDAAHVRSVFEAPDLYWEKTDAFISRFVD